MRKKGPKRDFHANCLRTMPPEKWGLGTRGPEPLKVPPYQACLRGWPVGLRGQGSREANALTSGCSLMVSVGSLVMSYALWHQEMTHSI